MKRPQNVKPAPIRAGHPVVSLRFEATMCDEWMPVIRVPMPIETFFRLPVHSAYKAEYVKGTTIL
jgi:hypothetical protein